METVLNPGSPVSVDRLRGWFDRHGDDLPLHLPSSELPEAFFAQEATDAALREGIVEPLKQAYGEWPFGAAKEEYLATLTRMHRDESFVFLRGRPGRWSVPDLVNRHGARRIAEVGVCDGQTAIEVLTHCPDLSSYTLVDHWATIPERHRMLEECLAGRDGVSIVKSPSVDAAKDVPDGSLDLVYIDAGHSFDDVKADIAAWWPKVADGGVLCGDDYQNAIFPESDRNRVRDAVNEAFQREELRWSFATPVNPIYYVVKRGGRPAPEGDR